MKRGDTRSATAPAWTAVKEAFDVLRWQLVPFNEHRQEFFCKVCRYRDPLGPDGSKLHDDNCPFLALWNALDDYASLRDAVDPVASTPAISDTTRVS